ncbi:MAG: hypothetical protein D6743_13965 [Calditrichaeota bacterium]|nr:MAG: hypothetical protein D6743_13965 [Calditrichota bacterium]
MKGLEPFKGWESKRTRLLGPRRRLDRFSDSATFPLRRVQFFAKFLYLGGTLPWKQPDGVPEPPLN